MNFQQISNSCCKGLFCNRLFLQNYQDVRVLWRTECLHHDEEPVYEYEWRTHKVAFACVCQEATIPNLPQTTVAPQAGGQGPSDI